MYIYIYISASFMSTGYAIGDRTASKQNFEILVTWGQRGCRYSLDGARDDDATARPDIPKRRIHTASITADRKDEPHRCLGRDEATSRGDT